MLFSCILNRNLFSETLLSTKYRLMIDKLRTRTLIRYLSCSSTCIFFSKKWLSPLIKFHEK